MLHRLLCGLCPRLPFTPAHLRHCSPEYCKPACAPLFDLFQGFPAYSSDSLASPSTAGHQDLALVHLSSLIALCFPLLKNSDEQNIEGFPNTNCVHLPIFIQMDLHQHSTCIIQRLRPSLTLLTDLSFSPPHLQLNQITCIPV